MRLRWGCFVSLSVEPCQEIACIECCVAGFVIVEIDEGIQAGRYPANQLASEGLERCGHIAPPVGLLTRAVKTQVDEVASERRLRLMASEVGQAKRGVMLPQHVVDGLAEPIRVARFHRIAAGRKSRESSIEMLGICLPVRRKLQQHRAAFVTEWLQCREESFGRGHRIPQSLHMCQLAAALDGEEEIVGGLLGP